jgi:hypothetical protein
MRAADRWAQIEGELGNSWTEARLSFAPEGSPVDAAAVLAPLQPVRVGKELRFHVTRSDGGPERVRNILGRLDGKRIWGTLELLDVSEHPAPPEASVLPVAPSTRSLAQSWDAALAELPPDWSDLLCELELDSTDHLPRAALLGAPMNPTRNPDAIALRFRASGKQGYGVSPLMARRCFERMDAEEITGRITVLQSLSDTENAVTQGPVWRVAGRSV